MTLYEIRARAMEQAGEIEMPPGGLHMALDGYINEAVHALCPGGVLETIEVEIVDGWTELREVREVCSVYGERGRPVPFFASPDGRLYVAGDGMYTARVMRDPVPLDQPNDCPPIPAVYHGALADYAAWRLLGTGGRTQQARGEMYQQSFLVQKSRFQQEVDGQRGARRRVNRFL